MMGHVDGSAEFVLVDSKVLESGDTLELWKNLNDGTFDVCRECGDATEYDAEGVTFVEAVKVYLG